MAAISPWPRPLFLGYPSAMRQIVLDTETTGLSTSQGHRIIEIGAIELVDRRLTGREYHRFLNPEREIDEGAEAVHGISLADLETAPLAGAGDIEINGSTAGTSDLDIDADIESSGTINLSAPRDVLVGAKLKTTEPDADIILTADSSSGSSTLS